VRTDLRSAAVVVDALTRLVAGRSGTLDDVQIEVYVEDLARFDPQLVARACERWRTVPRQEFQSALPEVGKLIQTIEHIAEEDAAEIRRAKYLPAPRDEDGPRYVCLQCHDGYWVISMWCPGRGTEAKRHARHEGLVTRDCGRRKPHQPHTWTEKCACVETNPVVQQQLQTQRGFVTQRAQKAQGQR
jgi:hypothetical protein